MTNDDIMKMMKDVVSGMRHILLFCWRLLQAPFDRRRLIRKIEAVIASAARLRQDIGEHGSGWDRGQRRLVANEILALLYFIANERLLRWLTTNELTAWHSAIESWAQDPASSDTTPVLVLDAIERAMLGSLWVAAARRRPTSGAMRLSPKPGEQGGDAALAPLGQSPPEGAAPGPVQAPPAGPFTPDEAALLASLTEKFYGSWTFRVASGMLVVAALFAIAGTVVVGDKTINLRQDLEQSAEKAKADIADRQKVTLAELERRRTDAMEKFRDLEQKAGDATKEITDRQSAARLAIASAQSELERGRSEYQKEMANGLAVFAETLSQRRSDLNSDVVKFRAETQALKDSAVKEAVLAVQAKLKGEEDVIRQQIMAPLEQARDQDLSKLHNSFTDLAKEIASLGESADQQREALNKTGPVLARLEALAAEAGNLENKLTNVKTYEEAAQASKSAAAQHASAAQAQEKAANEAATKTDLAKSNADAALAEIAKEAARHERTLGQMDSRFSTLEKAVAARESDAEALKSRLDAANKVPGEVEHALQALGTGRERLAKLEPEANAIEERVGAAKKILDGADTTLVRLVKGEARANSEDERLDQEQARIDKLKWDIDKLTPDIDKLKPDAEAAANVLARSKAARETVAQLEDAVKAAEERLKQLDSEIKTAAAAMGTSRPPPTEPSPPSSRTEKDLDASEWKSLQRALAGLRFQPGPIDGKAGAQTRAAIQRFQKQRGDAPTGELTSDQIEWLLKSVASHKQSASSAN